MAGDKFTYEADDLVDMVMPDGTVLRTHEDVEAYAQKMYDQPDTQVPPVEPPVVVLGRRPQ